MENNIPSFDIIMVTFNRAEYTKQTVASLISSGAFDKCRRLIIVDNHSTEPESLAFLETLKTFQKTFTVIRPKNDGWGTAVNEGLGLSRSEFVFVCCNDVVFNQGLIEKMFDIYAHQQNIGILGVWAHTAHSFIGTQNEWFREMTDVPAVGWLMPKEAMQKVGMLDEKGPCLTKGGNGEDTGYVQRMKAHGFLVGVPASDLAQHITGY